MPCLMRKLQAKSSHFGWLFRGFVKRPWNIIATPPLLVGARQRALAYRTSAHFGRGPNVLWGKSCFRYVSSFGRVGVSIMRLALHTHGPIPVRGAPFVQFRTAGQAGQEPLAVTTHGLSPPCFGARNRLLMVLYPWQRVTSFEDCFSFSMHARCSCLGAHFAREYDESRARWKGIRPPVYLLRSE